MYRRGFYLMLGGFVALLYGYLWVKQLDKPAGWEPPTAWSTQEVGAAALTLDSAKLLEVLRRDEGLARLVNLWGLVALFLLAGGLILSAQALARGTVWRVLRARDSHLPGTWLLGDVGRLFLLVVLVASLLPFVQMGVVVWTGASGSWTSSHLWSLVSMFLLEGWVALVVWGLATAKSRSWSVMLGFSRRGSLRAMEQAMMGYLACFPWLMGLLWAIVMLCERWHIQPPLEPIHELLLIERSPLVLSLTVVLACVVGPVVEEIFFRGVVFTALRTRTSRLAAMVISGGAFAAAHTNAVGFLPILLLGCLLAVCYERSGSLWAPIAVHVFHNSLLIGMALTLKALL
ncbi:MAG: hypothetical protein A3B73_06420 [Omnitrophica WOR_2 bacterium RIFCSPHIGHO2_02_FULL_63_39]|nr:MAG: hypothetical protein A3B73_06420 [Omnitrophica WOR_2 bacterium RIFCSPHIGHO2_02_FULL_63_39]OGX47620.1 MAG: hypothetical protein A3G88_07640 [Omnitrophica WOR_2 bacterium RIFCSPLOWO2_12_FULL_63_16]